MTSEALLLALALVASLLPLFALRRLPRGWAWLACAAAVALGAIGASLWQVTAARSAAEAEFRALNLPRPRSEGGYVSSDKCQSCHPSEYASWHRTYHRTMTQPATAESVRGDFDGFRIEAADGDLVLERRGDEFWVAATTRGASPGATDAAWRRVVMTTGSHQTQIYWVRGSVPNQLLIMPLAYLILEQRWVPVHDAFLKYPEKVRDYNTLWNFNCIHCHSTGGQPRPEGSRVDTRAAELGIACEACHGPAAEHVRVNGDPRRRYDHHLDDRGDPTIVNPARESPRASAEICGQCHGIFAPTRPEGFLRTGFLYRPGDDLAAHKHIVRPNEPGSRAYIEQLLERDPSYLLNHYWSDGAVRVSGREYNGLIESACYERGELTCLSCHSMHASDPEDQLASDMESDEACLQCHEPYRGKVAEHTHHEAASSGSRCYNCHMPYTSYGLLKALRSHQIDNPTVRASVETGRPNACNLCHLDQSLGWTQDYLARWYETPPVALTDEEREISAALLWLLRGDAGQRALSAWAMGWEPAQETSGEEWLAPFLAPLLDDPYSAVRFIAGRSLGRIPGAGETPYDHQAPRSERLRARQAVLEAWLRSPGVDPERRGARILVDDDGSLDLQAMARLLGQRDERQLDLAE